MFHVEHRWNPRCTRLEMPEAFRRRDEVHVGLLSGLIDKFRQGLQRTQDLVLAPDGGNEAGDFIEIAEKTPFWLEFTVEGRQVHGSRPDLGRYPRSFSEQPSPALPPELRCAADHERLAQALIAPDVLAYIEGGSGRVLLRADDHGADVPANRGIMFTAVNWLERDESSQL